MTSYRCSACHRVIDPVEVQHNVKKAIPTALWTCSRCENPIATDTFASSALLDLVNGVRDVALPALERERGSAEDEGDIEGTYEIQCEIDRLERRVDAILRWLAITPPEKRPRRRPFPLEMPKDHNRHGEGRT